MTRLGAACDRSRGSVSHSSKIFLSFPKRPDRLWSLVQRVAEALTPGVERPERENERSPYLASEVRMSARMFTVPLSSDVVHKDSLFNFGISKKP